MAGATRDSDELLEKRTMRVINIEILTPIKKISNQSIILFFEKGIMVHALRLCEEKVIIINKVVD